MLEISFFYISDGCCLPNGTAGGVGREHRFITLRREVVVLAEDYMSGCERA